jgi:hypothetical protein
MDEVNLGKTMRGSAHVGPYSTFGYHAPWPWASLNVSASGLRFSLWPVVYHFERQSIVALCVIKIFGLRYLRIVHSRPKYEKWVLFKPLSIATLQRTLESAGYQLSEPSAITEPVNVQYGGFVKTVSWVAAVICIAAIIAALYGVTR